ncbi:type II CAAX prenyl endopeptidase Rce1 family protein [Egicoccus sp. AB-alg2]|uniref:CPBP family glutamic-type intramembrane protease n=1 Tax=Egicoccus sp. AB-alg2 TaxID=3242693 RepID=UPI00359D4BA0
MSAAVGTSSPRRARRREALPVLQYFVLTYLWTWGLWWAAAASGGSFGEPTVLLLFVTGGLGPLAGASWVVRRRGPSYRREFLRRVWDPRRIPAAWWLALVAVATGPALVGAAVTRVTGTAATVPDHGVEAVAGVVVFALAAGLVEEPGWRGAASDAWQATTRPLLAATGIGTLWALWHLPLYFVDGSYQHGLEFGSLRFWLTNLVLVQLGVLYLWLANGSRGSILVPILAHAGFNVAGELVPRSTTGDVVAFLVVTVATVVVVVTTRGRLELDVAGRRGSEPARSASVDDE